jgi:hypothetical protein
VVELLTIWCEAFIADSIPLNGCSVSKEHGPGVLLYIFNNKS